jgi:hypothetical protein
MTNNREVPYCEVSEYTLASIKTMRIVMTRITLVAFVLLTGFFYITGKPVDETGPLPNTFADLAKHKVLVGQVSKSINPEYLDTASHSQLGQNGPVGEIKSIQQKSRAAAPQIPVRNPRRIAPLSPQYAKFAAKHDPVATRAIKKPEVDNKKPELVFGEARNKFTVGAVKPLVVSYQQRYVKVKKPVLGPRLTTVLLKRELKRVGCYRGNVSGNWDDEAQAALQLFNTNSGANLPLKIPAVATLEKLQQVRKTVCVNKPEKPTAGQAIIANARPALLKSGFTKKSNQWRTKIQYKKTAYHPLPTSVPPLYNDKNTRSENVLTIPAVKRTKKKYTITKRYRSKRRKKIRIARRKAKRRTAVRSWKRTYRRKRFGFRHRDGSFSFNN